MFEKSGIAFRLSMEFPQTQNDAEQLLCNRPDQFSLGTHLASSSGSATRRSTTHNRFRAVSDAIFYLLRTGCQWRLLPREFPVWGTVDHYFRSWKNAGVSGHCLYHRTCALSGVIRNQAMLRKR